MSDLLNYDHQRAAEVSRTSPVPHEWSQYVGKGALPFSLCQMIVRQLMTKHFRSSRALSKSATLIFGCLSLIIMMGLGLQDSHAQSFSEVQARCQGTAETPCLPTLIERPIQRSLPVFYLQARISPSKVPTGRGELNIFVNLSNQEGDLLCSETLGQPAKIRDGVLNVEIGRGMNCALDEVLAENTNLRIQLCLGSSSSCLRPIDLTSVPFAFSANTADEVARARSATMAAQARYTQRVTADADVLFPQRIGYGYFDFFTHPVEDRGLLYPEESDYLSYLNSGFIQWTPTRGYEGAHERFVANRVYLVGESEQGSLKLLMSVSVAARSTRVMGSMKVYAGHLQQLGDSDLTENRFEHNLLVARRAEAHRLQVRQGMNVTGDTIISRSLDARQVNASRADLRGVARVDTVEVQGQVDIDTRTAEMGPLTIAGETSIGAPTRVKVEGSAQVGSGSIDDPDDESDTPVERGLFVKGESAVGGPVKVAGTTTMTRDGRDAQRILNRAQGVWMKASPDGVQRRAFGIQDDAAVVVNLTPPITDQIEPPEPARVRIKANEVIFEQQVTFRAGQLGSECRLIRGEGTTFSFECGEQTLRFASDQCGNGRRFRCSCGDGELNLGEACDDGNESDTDACLRNCTLPTCGDGYVRADITDENQDGYEECDDRNTVDDDACSNTCRAAVCGDNILRLDLPPGAPDYEECDQGANNGPTQDCTEICTNARCGDERVWVAGNEQCDDGNLDNHDACTNNCQVAVCGDGILYRGVEECDDGNTVNGDGCDSQCYVEVCGNGRRQAGEECDDGNDNQQDACTHCRVARCGDGVLYAGVEECDDGNNDNYDTCRSNCTQYCRQVPKVGHFTDQGITIGGASSGGRCAQHTGERCYWMESYSGNYCWVPAPQGSISREQCIRLDSCSPGGGRLSGGGCYKWDTSSYPQQINVNTQGNPTSPTSASGAGGPQAAIGVTLSQRTRVTFETTQQDYDAYFHLRARCDDQQSIAADDDSSPIGRLHPEITRWVDPGEYFLIVDGFNGESGRSTVRMRLDNCEGTPIDHTIISPRIWLPFVGNITLPISGSLNMNNQGGATVARRRCGGNGPQRAVRVQLQHAARVQFWTSSGHDPVLHLRRDVDCGRSEDIVCDDDGGSGLNSRLSAQLSAGTYYLVIDGYFGRSGPITVFYDIR